MSAPPLPSVTCPACHQPCDPEARFCPHCGKLVGEVHASADPTVGQLIAGRYHVEERLGGDGLGRVYRANAQADGAPVVLRIVHEHLTANRAAAGRLQEAASIASGLATPGLVRLIEAGQTPPGSASFLVNEAFEGRNLCSIVQVRGLLPVQQAIALCLRAADALGELHAQGVAHGDLKPENVIVGASSDGEVSVRLSDAVISAWAARAVPRLCIGGSALGTPVYRAPELQGGAAPTAVSDVYSIAAITYEQLTGTRLFDTVSSLAYERAQLRALPIEPRRRAPWRGIGPAVEQALMRALSREPAQRYASASAFAAALRNAAAEDAPAGPTPRPESGRSGAFGFVQRRSLVGRTDLTEAVLASAARATTSSPAQHPRGTVVVLLGGAGMGKSAIVQEVSDRLAGGAAAVLQVDGRTACSRPLEPFVELAREVLGVERGADAECVSAVSSALVSTFGIDGDDVVRLIDRVAARPSSLAVAPDVVEREEVAALRSFLGRVIGARPTVLVVEDADALDAASLELVRDLMHAARTLPLCVLVTVRADPWPDWTADHVARLTVPALDPQASQTLLRSRLAGRSVPGDVVELAVHWAKGSPLVIELCARAMVRRELLVGSDGRWVPPSGSQDLFGGLRELVAMTLRSARPPVRRWLSCAAVAGHRVPLAFLETWEAPGGSRDELAQACSAAGMVRVSNGCLVFENQGVRDIVRTLVPEADRKHVGLAYARWLRETTPARAGLEVIAEQLELGGEGQDAAKTYELEAQDLVDRGEARASYSLWARAQKLYADVGALDSALRAGVAHAEALLAAGDGRGASEMLGQLERLGPVEADGLRARAAAAIAVAQGEHDLALRALRRASDVAVDSLDQLAWYEVEFSLGMLLHELGRFDDAHTHASLALELARSLADGEAAGRKENERASKSAAFLGRVLVAKGRMEEARVALQSALEKAALTGDEASAARLLGNLAHAWMVSGDTSRALEFGQRALDFARRAGDRMATARVALNVGAYLAKLGRTGDAARSFALAKSQARAIGWDRGVRLARDASASLVPEHAR